MIIVYFDQAFINSKSCVFPLFHTKHRQGVEITFVFPVFVQRTFVVRQRGKWAFGKGLMLSIIASLRQKQLKKVFKKLNLEKLMLSIIALL